MKKNRLALASTFTLVLLTVLAGTALAGSSHWRGHHDRSLKAFLNVRGGPEFWIPVLVPLVGGPKEEFLCPEFKFGTEISPVEGASIRIKKAFVKSTPPDGRKRVILDDLVFGIAIDQYGHKYFYVYKNKATITYDPDELDPEGVHGVAHVNMIDSFRLRGRNANFRASFDWDWTYRAPDGGALVVEEFNLGVAPFDFPTVDGETKSDFAITWVKNRPDVGSPFLCDPI